jgi:hypothetical protein
MIELESYMSPIPTFRRGRATQVRVKLESIRGGRYSPKRRGSWLVPLFAYLSAFLREGVQSSKRKNIR